MTKPQANQQVASDDYRRSHLQRGSTYDANLEASPFDRYMAQFERAYLREVVPGLFPGSKPRYLDFACGTGRITETVAPLCGESVGVDVSPSMLAEAREKCPGVRFVEADITKSDVDLGTFDLATSFRFFGNAQQELRIAVLKGLHRLLRPNAYLIINSHRNPRSISAMLNSLTGGRDQSMDLNNSKFKTLLRSTGFEIDQIRPIGVWMYRDKLQRLADIESPWAKRMESVFSHRGFAAIAPDAVIVAKRVN